jgi:transketolase
VNMEINELVKKAKELRLSAIESLYTAQSGHPGSALSMMDVLTAIYYSEKTDDDKVLLSAGHAVPAIYAILTDMGELAKNELGKLRQLGAKTQGHPHRGSISGIEMSSGSLGQGLSVGLGVAYAKQLKKEKGRVFVLMSDGEQEEGSTWEAVMYAPKRKLNNLIAIVDKNGMQIDGFTKDVMPGLDDLGEKYRAFNWSVREIDGHNFEEILKALKWASEQDKPAVIISNTVRGKGLSFMENSEHWHAGAISDEQIEIARKELA